MSSTTTIATIDLTALRHNASRLARAAGGAELMAVVKANGYGHGAVPCAQAALDGGAGSLAVASVEEAERLFDYLRAHRVHVFYARTPVEFGTTGEDGT